MNHSHASQLLSESCDRKLTVLGTPFYMAPEKAAGRVHQIVERMDVFGLGGILFTFCTQFRNKKMKTGMALRGDVPIFDDGDLFGFLSVMVEPANSLRHDYANKSVGFYAQKIEIEDIPGRVLTAVVCASTLSTDN